jgi:hypothetical protein
MSESLSYLTPFQQAMRNATGYDPLAPQTQTAPIPTSVLEQLLAAERARSLAAPGSPEAPEAPRAYGDMEGDSASNPSPSIPSPDQSARGMFNAALTAGSLLAGPAAFASRAGLSLALADLTGRAPSFNMSTPGMISSLGEVFGLTAPTGLAAANRADLTGFSADMAQTEDKAEAEAMAQGLQSPTFGTGSYGFGTPSTGGSGDFSAQNQTERDDAMAAALGHEHGLDAYGNPGGAPGSNPGAGGYGATDSSEDGGYGGESQFKAGGLVPLAGGGKIAIGPGGGLDDLIPTSINGRRAAALSDGEFVMPADVVSMMGDGSSNAGARRLYDMVRQIRESKTGTSRQAGPLPVGEILKRTMS